jgi:hypothetical protein
MRHFHECFSALHGTQNSEFHGQWQGLERGMLIEIDFTVKSMSEAMMSLFFLYLWGKMLKWRVGEIPS